MIRHRKTVISIIAVFIVLTGLTAFLFLDKNMRKVCLNDEREIIQIEQGANQKILHINAFNNEFSLDVTGIENMLNEIIRGLNSENKKDLSNCRYC